MTIMSQRYCGNCVHYRKGNEGCPGQCNHPTRQATSDVPVYVRARELACRSTWNEDFWQQGVLQLDEPTVHVRDIVVWQSVSLDLAPDEFPEDLLDWLVSLAADEGGAFDLRDWLT